MGRTGKPRVTRAKGKTPAPPALSHLDARGQARMVDVGAKAATERIAVAEGKVIMRRETLELVVAGNAAAIRCRSVRSRSRPTPSIRCPASACRPR
jgi:hypothetical protein